MEHKNVRCVDCIYPRLLTKEELQGQQSETVRCKIDGTSKTKYCIWAIKDCSRFVPGVNELPDDIEEPGEPNCRCQDCALLVKVPYLQSQSTHHENWESKGIHFSMQFEDTLAKRFCPRFKPGKPENRS